MPQVRKKPAAKVRGGAAGSKDFDAVFGALKPLFSRYESGLEVVADQPGKYYLRSKGPVFQDKPLWFGGVEIKKNYVSFHLIAIYVFPELANNISPELKKRKQGKACFNFTAVDAKLFAELDRLTEAGAVKLRSLKPGSPVPKGNCN
jgi:hypothetical protein